MDHFGGAWTVTCRIRRLAVGGDPLRGLLTFRGEDLMRVWPWGFADGDGGMKSVSRSRVELLEFYKLELIGPGDWCEKKKSKADFWVSDLIRECRQEERACRGEGFEVHLGHEDIQPMRHSGQASLKADQEHRREVCTQATEKF